jgi:glycosyltransferase involved in cell wall biosynthesis
MGEPLVSVIVPVRDNPEGIEELLGRLRDQTLPHDRFEVVIGDDGSYGELPGNGHENGQVRVTRGPRLNAYAARNRAVELARGRVLAFCDSDCLPERTWLEEGLAALEHSDVVAGEVTFFAPRPPTVWSLLTIDMFLDQERAVRLSRAVTANLFVRRELFDELGGFDDSLPSGGDYEFVLRAVEQEARLAYAPGSVVRHPTLDKPRAFLGKVLETNRWAAFRRARAGYHPTVEGMLVLVPFVGLAVARHRALRPIGTLCRPRLTEAGLTPDWRDDVRALPVLYLPVAAVAGFGRARGWFEGMRTPRTGGMSWV